MVKPQAEPWPKAQTSTKPKNPPVCTTTGKGGSSRLPKENKIALRQKEFDPLRALGDLNKTLIDQVAGYDCQLKASLVARNEVIFAHLEAMEKKRQEDIKEMNKIILTHMMCWRRYQVRAS